MSIRYSDAALASLAGDVGLRQLVSGAKIIMFTGSQPSSPNESIGSAQPIVTFTDDNGLYVAEIQSQWSYSLSGLTGTVSVTSITIGGIEILGETITGTDTNTLQSNVSSAINSNTKAVGFKSTSSGDTLVVQAIKGSGASLNAQSIMIQTTGTVTVAYNDTAHTGAVSVLGANSVNGLNFNLESSGSILSPSFDGYIVEKKTSQTWKGRNGYNDQNVLFSGITSGTSYAAGWGRICVDSGDTGIDATSGSNGYSRIDFSVGSSNADCIMLPNTNFYVNTTSGSEVESLINSFILKINRRMS